MGCQFRTKEPLGLLFYVIYSLKEIQLKTQGSYLLRLLFYSYKWRSFYIANNVFIRNNKYFYTERPSNEGGTYGIKLDNINGLFINGNHLFNGPLGGSQGAILFDNNIKNSAVSNNFIQNWCYSIAFNENALSGKIVINNNIIYSHGVAVICEIAGSFIGELDLYNNSILINPTSTYSQPIRFNNTIIPAGSFVKVTNNIIGFLDPYYSGRYIMSPSTTNGVVEIDYNLYWNSSRSDPYYSQGAYNWTDWNKLGYDIHSLNNTDPLFKNASGAFSLPSDFELQSNSIAIDAGINLGITTDFFGKPISGTPDMGAIETQEGEYTPKYLNSVIEDATPTKLEMTYNAILDKKIPPPGDFKVMINESTSNIVTAVTISDNKVLLTLTNAIAYNQKVTVSYTKSGTIWLQTSSGNPAADLSNELVTNNCKDKTLPNKSPVPVINYPASVYSGFIYEINASGSTDPDNDILDFIWSVPADFPVSDTIGPVMRFLAPYLTAEKSYTFRLKVSDRRDPVYQTFSIKILPYKPELSVARIENILASSYLSPYYPINMTDNDLTTRWSAEGDNQWLLFKLGTPFKIDHIVLSFLQNQKYKSYFDIFASKDNVTWDPVLTGASSCNFSGERQVFNFPVEKTRTDYSFLKLIGHENSLNSWNDFSEIKLLGSISENPENKNSPHRNVVIYPNPAQDYFNISIEESTLVPNLVLLIDYSGRVVFESPLESSLQIITIPDHISSGNYIVELRSGKLILDTQIIIINRSRS